jgi:2-oxo-4-hydroxy-4-carboxy-5-ureidoimidazoline decarboxylase
MNMKLDELNLLDRGPFVNAIGWVFEDSPWVAERAWARRPFRDLDALHKAMVKQVATASTEEQLALLCAHPDLGTRAKISDASVAEQAGVGLDKLTSLEFEQLQQLNARYRDKFGFPFLYAVKGSTKHDILRSLRERVEEPAEQEFREALQQVYRIARFRLEDTIV